MEKFIKILNAILILILVGVLTGAFAIQIFHNEEPCPFCLLQRLAMIGIGIGALLNLRFGNNPQHYAISILSAILGAAVALRQIALHICPGFPTYGEPVLGLSLYTWSFLVFTCSIFYIALLLFIGSYTKGGATKKYMHPCSWTVLAILFLVTLANVFTTYQECLLGPCGG